MMGEYDAGYENYIDSLIREIEKLQDENDKLSEQVSSLVGRSFRTADKMSCIEDDNAKLREEIEAAKHDLQVFSMGSVQLEAENAKLREQSERLFDKTLELGTENSKLRELCKLCEREAENAKLRELVRDLWEACPADGYYCIHHCEHYDKESESHCKLEDRMRELGVDDD